MNDFSIILSNRNRNAGDLNLSSHSFNKSKIEEFIKYNTFYCASLVLD